MREDLLLNAVSFLKDPKVQQAPLAKRISFLESKGLTQEEIQEALSRTTGQIIEHKPPPLPPSLTWKDYTLTAVSLAGLTYAGIYLFQTFIKPQLGWPSASQFDECNEQMEQQFKVATDAIESVKSTSNEIENKLEEHSKNVADCLTKIKQQLNELNEQQTKRDEEMSQIQSEVDSIKEMLPKMLDKSRDNQTTQLIEIQNEIKSLKNLMNRREQDSPKPKATIPSWQLESTEE